jgi:hypothetical protein
MCGPYSRVETTRGSVPTDPVVVCPGNDFLSLFPEAIAAHHPVRCKLSRRRLARPG